MNRPMDTRWPHRATGAALLLLLIALACSLTQCRMVGDELVGPRLSRGADDATTCATECAHVSNEAIRAESDRHVQAVHDCAGDEACLAAEEALHEAEVERIQAARVACQDQCHDQGAGRGGPR